MDEQIQLIMECRRNRLSDFQWCATNGGLPRTFYNMISWLRKAGYTFPILESKSVTVPVEQEVVKVPVVSNDKPGNVITEQKAGNHALPLTATAVLVIIAENTGLTQAWAFKTMR